MLDLLSTEQWLLCFRLHEYLFCLYVCFANVAIIMMVKQMPNLSKLFGRKVHLDRDLYKNLEIF